VAALAIAFSLGIALKRSALMVTGLRMLGQILELIYAQMTLKSSKLGKLELITVIDHDKLQRKSS
jgi:hypothetical protein